jgi:solute carrier family 25 (mitochondrial adenine nucleotide translocator), member 4/5/6/31
VGYPFDTVRRRLMMMAGRTHVASVEIQYTSTHNCWNKMYKQEGLQGFFKGALVNTVRGMGCALVLVLYDELQRFFTGSPPAHPVAV